MAKRNGGIIGPANTPTASVAAGVWRLRDAFNSIKNGTWPLTRSVATNSLRFNSASSDRLNRTESAGNRRTWTFSCWIKKTFNNPSPNYQALFTSSGANYLSFSFTDTNALQYYNSSTISQLITTQLFRDVSAWYNIVLAVDTTQATASNRVRIYVNGSEVTAFSTSTYPSQNTDLNINNSQTMYVGAFNTTQDFMNGYMSEIHFVDGQQLTPSSFGASNSSGVWYPIAYQGTWGTNGFYLKFANSASLGTDSSGNGNNFTVNNLTSVDQSTDTELNNFSTMNSLDQNGGMVFSEGNLSNASTSASWRSTRGTFGITQGKWYFEVKVTNVGGALLDMMVGIADFSLAIPSEFSSSNPALTYTAGSGNKQLNGVNSAYGATYNINDIIGVAFDANALTVTFYKNGVSQGTITTGWSSGLTWSPAISLYGRYSNTQASFNFGNPSYSANGYTDAAGYGNFSYAVPSGYYALCTKNLNTYG